MIARLLTAAAVAAATLGLATAAPAVLPAAAADGCAPGRPPLDADSTPVDNGDMLWVSRDGVVGVTSPGGTGSVRVPNAGPQPLRALMFDAENNGQWQLIVSNGRVAHLFAVTGCEIAPVIGPDGKPFLFDLQNLRGNGTGVGCIDFGDGRVLVGLQALPQRNRWVVHRTEIDVDGTAATIGRSDTVTADSDQDPAVTSAQTITCGQRTMNQDGVRQP